jgi:hypothetical protein
LTYSNSLAAALWGGLLHLVNFALPALVLALLLAPAVTGRRNLSVRALWRAWCWLAATGLGVQLAGLLVFGRDGKMVTYSALVLALGSLACWLQWRLPRTATPAKGRPRRR